MTCRHQPQYNCFEQYRYGEDDVNKDEDVSTEAQYGFYRYFMSVRDSTLTLLKVRFGSNKELPFSGLSKHTQVRHPI